MLITSLGIVSSIILTYVNVYFISKILKKKLEINLKNILIILLLVLIAFVSDRVQSNLFSMLLQFISLNIVINVIFNVSFEKCIVSTILFYLVLIICDVTTVALVKLVNIDLNSLSLSERKLIGDTTVIILVTIISKIYHLILMFQNIVNNVEKKIIRYISIGIIVISIIYMYLYYNVIDKSIDEIIINFCMLMLIVFIFIKFFIEKINKQNVVKEFDKVNEYVKIYEEIIEKDRIRRHENKNQLITIKGMISKRDKKTHEYIDTLIGDNSDKTYKWISELKYIPIGGLKGLLFYKVNKMREQGIEVDITISRSLEESKLQNIDAKLYKHLCQIIGVYIDNAIEACQEANIKCIGIEIYKDGDIFEFIISNTYSGVLQIDNMDSAGYTTKGDGHGYGLSLVRDIINSNPQFFQNREIINDYYIQHLFLDLTE